MSAASRSLCLVMRTYHWVLSADCHHVQGLKHGAKIVLRGEAGCSDPSVQPGDVVFVLDQKEHRFFKRINQVPLALMIVRFSCEHCALCPAAKVVRCSSAMASAA